MPGVVRTRVGYAGGEAERPTYDDLFDHAEAIEVVYDPARLSYERLLEVFWDSHEPTYRSGSKQYRAFLFVHDEGQRRLAEASRDRLQTHLGRPVRTEIVDAGRFWPAEDYHQKYTLRRFRDIAAELMAHYPDPADFRDSTAAARLNGYLAGYGGDDADLGGLGLSPEALAQVRAAVR